jgi:hypothetical protein
MTHDPTPSPVGIALLALLPHRRLRRRSNEAERSLALLPDRKAAAKLGEAWLEEEHPRSLARLQDAWAASGGDGRSCATPLRKTSAAARGQDGRLADSGGRRRELCALAYFKTTGSL